MLSHIQRAYISAFIFMAVLPAVAQAGLIYSYHFDQSQYVVAAGATVNVGVYLRESFDQGDTTLLDLEGLFGAGVRVVFNVQPVPGDPAQVLSLGDINPNPTFDSTATTFDLVSGESAGFTSNVGVSLFPVNAVGGVSFNEVLLGTFTFTAGLNQGEVTHLRATDFDTGTDDIVTNTSFSILDSLVTDGVATITVSGVQSVPEPSSILMFGTAAIVLGCYRRKLWK